MNRLSKPQIVLRRVFKHPIEKVWSAVATEEGLAGWLMPAEGFLPIVGQEFTLKTKAYGKFDGVVRCEILEIDPPNRLRFSWESNTLPMTEVAFTLKQTADRETLLTLEHYGFRGLSGYFIRMILGAGWWNLFRKKLTNYLSK